MLKAVLPNNKELRVPWSNIAPCSTISEALVDELGLAKTKLRSARGVIAIGVTGYTFGDMEEWYCIKELTIKLPIIRIPENLPESSINAWARSVRQSDGLETELQEITVGPLLILENLTPLVLGGDLLRATGYSLTLGGGYYRFPFFNAISISYDLELFDSEGEPVLGSVSWRWNTGVEINTCAYGACGFEFPNLMTCSRCRVVFYCTRMCQRAHWREHRRVCQNQH
mmetsp:Transcript_11914/g.19682  ORF Transcript_11914/g.19682 Transcript_11914/m.19682 type:complete len:227 (-) Transcript_11914:435-1115(-)